MSRRSLRGQIAYVGQDVFLFRGTIRENIAFGKPGATEDEIVAAAKAAHAHEFIMGFPRGYDTPVGEHGLQLSGGQRQRVAIARALIKNAPIILLDEATAALDSESERLVQDAMAHLREGRTTIVIAHRLHTIAHADRILVIEDGAIVESGRHEELLRKNGRYASFYRLQLKQQEPAPPIAIASAACKHETPASMSTDKSYVIPPPPQAALAIAGSDQVFPVRRIWCVGRNYLEHIKEMGQDEREPPFFFAKPADAIVPDGGTAPYPSLTKDMHHEVELVVALKSGGRNIPVEKALDCVWGYGVGIDLTRRDLQIASRDIKRPWEIGKAFDASAPCGPLQAGERDRPSRQGPHHAQVQRQGAPGRRPRADDLERAGDDLEALRDGGARRAATSS